MNFPLLAFVFVLVATVCYGDSTTDGFSVNNDTEIIPPVSTVQPNPDTTTTIKPGPPPTTTKPTPPTTTPPTTAPPKTTTPSTTTSTIPPAPAPNTTTSTTTTATTAKTTTPIPTNSTTTTKSTPKPTPTTPPPHDRHFDGPSFIGGIILASGLIAIGFAALKYYKVRADNYHTL